MGGTYPSPTMAGSRTPVMLVACYAVLIYYGKNKYIDQANKIYQLLNSIRQTLAPVCKKYNLKIIGDPIICTIAFTGNNALHLFDLMLTENWSLKFISKPDGFNLQITLANIEEVKNEFCKDFSECCEKVKFKLKGIFSYLQTIQN
jgi:sphinganine-1-phosphate aldolase